MAIRKSSERRRYLADAPSEKLMAREAALIEACKIANKDPQVQAIEKEFDAITDAFPNALNCD